MGEAVPAGTKKVIFHVGAPKTGTTYLQQVLWQNREALAANGVLYPYADFGQSFRSMQDFRGAGWGNKGPGHWAGEWDDVAQRTRDWTGHTVIISNELFGGTDPERIRTGLESIRPADIHVVFTARDFARQLVSDWQEQIKHKHTVTLEQFVDDLIEKGIDAPAPFGELFWGMHDAAYVLPRWEVAVPRENIHIVTVPQPGAPRDTLWLRFCEVTGLDPEAYETETKRSNASMGAAETELVRRINLEAQHVPGEDYDRLVRIILAERILGGQPPKLTLPEGRFEWVAKRSRELVDTLREAGYPVVGDLDELLPLEASHADHVSPTAMSDQDLGPAAVRAATGLLLQATTMRRRIRELEGKVNPAPPPARTPRDRARDFYWRNRGRVGKVLRKAGLLRR